MSVLVNKKTKILVQGITGTQASFHIQRAMKYGTKVVAGVVPSSKEKFHLGVPVFNTVKEAKKKTGANASIVFVPAKSAKKAIFEAIDAELELVVVITSGIPIGDMMEIKHKLKKSKTILIGPNTPGIITPKEAYMGIFPDNIHMPGSVGVVSKSSTLTYEIVLELNKIGLGQSTVIGLGDDYIIGSDFTDVIEKFNDDPKTKATVLVCGIGGIYEIDVAQKYAMMKNKKPVIVLMINGAEILSKDIEKESEAMRYGLTLMSDKIDVLKNAGIVVVDTIQALKEELKKIC